MRFYDLFSGIGGFHRGLELASSQYECVGACEWHEPARKVYAHHWPDVQIDWDATKLERLPRGTELLCAGFPCQPFSLAGRRRGFDDTRGTAFFEVIRLAARGRTPYILLENVTGLLGNDSGRTFGTMLRSLDACGYDAQWISIDGFGAVPQTRQRVFVVANLRDRRAPEILSLAAGDRWDREARRKEWALQGASALTTGCGKHQAANQNIILERAAPRPRFTDHAGTLLAQNVRAWGHDNTIVLRPARAGTIEGAGLLRGEYYARRLTPLECERLMGFQDGHTIPAGSDFQRYEMLGNSVIPDVVRRLGELLAEAAGARGGAKVRRGGGVMILWLKISRMLRGMSPASPPPVDALVNAVFGFVTAFIFYFIAYAMLRSGGRRAVQDRTTRITGRILILSATACAALGTASLMLYLGAGSCGAAACTGLDQWRPNA